MEAPGRQLIESYGGGRFRVSGKIHEGPVLVFPERVQPWPAGGSGEITLQSLGPAIEAAASIDLLLVGCGAAFAAEPKGLRAALNAAGLLFEWMDTGAACRTFNVLIAEERRVEAALVAVE